MANNYMMQPVNPGQSFSDTMQMVQNFNQLRAQKDARQLSQYQVLAAQSQAKEQAALKEEFSTALKVAHDNPTAENYMKLSDLHAMYNPEKAKAFRESWAMLDADRQQNTFRDSVNMLTALETDPEYAISMMQELAEAAKNTGNMAEAKKYQTLISAINVGDIGLQTVKDSFIMTIGNMPNGKEALAGIVNYAKEKRDAAAEPTVQRQRLLDAGKTEAETDKIMAETRKLDSETKNLAVELAIKDKAGGLTPKNVVDTEIQLNNTVNTRLAAGRDARTAYENIKAGAEMDDGVGDMAIINTFMRMLSPGIVTEQDYSAATKSGGLIDELKTLGGQVEKGDRLSAQNRVKFVTLSKQFMENAKKQNEEQIAGIRSIVKSYGLNEENVFGPEPKEGTATVSPSQDLTPMRTFLKTKWPDEAAKIDSLDLAGLQREYKNTLAGYKSAGTTTGGTAVAPEPVRTGTW